MTGKNKKGGSGHKRMARKFLKPNNITRKLREAKEGEMYAKVTRVNGGGVCEVLCNDLKERQMIIRRKFRGRNKRDNNVSVGTIVLVGLRDWEVLSVKKKPKVDLLEVYGTNDMEGLKKLKTIHEKMFPENEIIDKDEPFVYDTNYEEMDVNEEEKLQEELNKKLENIVEEKEVKDEPDFDWDDI